MEDGRIVKGLAGVPDEGPVLLVGYHMLMGLELGPMSEAFIKEKNILFRGMAHPILYAETDSTKEFGYMDWIKVFGAYPVTATNLFKLLSSKSHVLLYPGGAREALHNRVSHLHTLFVCLISLNGQKKDDKLMKLPYGFKQCSKNRFRHPPSWIGSEQIRLNSNCSRCSFSI